MYKRISSLLMVMVLSLMVIIPVSAQENTQKTIALPTSSSTASAEGIIEVPIGPDSENSIQSVMVLRLPLYEMGTLKIVKSILTGLALVNIVGGNSLH